MANNKMRTFLSLLGIVIGVGSVVAILNLGQSATASINESMEIGGINMVKIMPSSNSRYSSIFDESFGDTLMQNVADIDKVLPMVSSVANIRNGQEIKSSISIQGVTSDYFEVNSLTLSDGSFFTSLDNINRRQVVVLGKTIADELFPVGGAVGQYVSIYRTQAKSYQVVGVLEEKDATLGSSYNSAVFIPYNTYDQRFRKISQVQSYTVKVSDGANAIQVSNQIEAYLNETVGSDNFSIFSPASLVEMANQITSTFSLFLAAIAAISLIVGGIGIMNIMLVSVVERTREIGIRKALGATPKTIRGQFLVESITLTVFGGIIGLVLGGVISYAVVTVAGWNLHLSYAAVFLALGFSTFVGVFFGWYPAMKASKLDPIDALSYE
ncbi:MAG: ABC transporter permease [Candidatus Ornithospirochaeta sp.]|nr:ABC transporter permease [Candidatus Ornithospirochaeta sp.]